MVQVIISEYYTDLLLSPGDLFQLRQDLNIGIKKMLEEFELKNLAVKNV